MSYQERLERMVESGTLSAEQAKEFERSIAGLPSVEKPARKPLPVFAIGAVLAVVMLGGVVVKLVTGAASDTAVIQNIAQSMNQVGATGDLGSAATSLMTIFLLLMIPVTVIILLIARQYNILTRLEEETRLAKSIIESALQRRHDLIPALMSVVKQAMTFEETLQSSVAGHRSGAAAALESALKEQKAEAAPALLAVMEAYPTLRAQENILSLQQSLQQVEGSLQAARNFYGAASADFNSARRGVLGGFVAGLCGMSAEGYFSADTEARQN